MYPGGWQVWLSQDNKQPELIAVMVSKALQMQQVVPLRSGIIFCRLGEKSQMLFIEAVVVAPLLSSGLLQWAFLWHVQEAQPSYKDLQELLRATEGSNSGKTWVERIKGEFAFNRDSLEDY